VETAGVSDPLQVISTDPTGAAAIVLLSGGLDSATCLAIAQRERYVTHAISFRYGQRHEYELERASRLAAHFAVASHRIVDINLGQFGGSALTDHSLIVPKSDSLDSLGTDIPITYVPARNTVFLSLALAFAEVSGSRDIFIGVNALDYSGYPDCRSEFIAAFETMANLATKSAVQGGPPIKIHTPLLHLSKAEIISLGLGLGVDYSMTLSCYDPGPGGVPCGRCDACLLRKKGFLLNGIVE